jgi:exosome complex RNA-binding protein Rrp4
VQQFDEEQSDDSLVDDLTRLEELREAAVIQLTKHQHTMKWYHAQNVSSHNFQVGDFVLRKIQMTKDRHKLSLVDDLTWLEELREAAVIQLTKHQQTMKWYHAQNVSSHSFQVGDFVLRKIQMTKDRHKLSLT